MLIHEIHWLTIHEQRRDELMKAAQHHRLVRALAAARRTEQQQARKAARQAAPRLPRRALAATGRGLVHVGQWLQCAAQQPSY